jgi:predicted GNAT superfamily acetyltransferase
VSEPAPHHVTDWTLRALDGWPDLEACVRLQEETWGAGFSERVPPTLLRLVQRLGGLLEGAFDASGVLLGFVFGMPGLLDGALVHWSDMLAVRASDRGRGIGEALKLHQRRVLLERGWSRVCWTFEPLEARNAHLNIARLGAIARTYVRDFYGPSDSPLHTQLGTDRIIATWEIGSARTEQRLSGSAPTLSADAIERLPAVVEPIEPADAPRPAAPRLEVDGRAVKLAIPANVQQLKARDPALSSAWRGATRTAFEAFFARGYRVEEFVRGEPVGWYVLRRV